MSLSYLEFNFSINPLQPASDILLAELGEIGFESFTESETGLQAYIQTEEYREGEVENLQILNSSEFEISWEKNQIEQVNWNREWEKNFNPIIVGEKCSVRAPFHPKPQTEYDIVIEPKMSFGTGHHATTHMMLQFILNDEWKGLSVLDMGCGTGVLAILTAMKGAGDVVAIDIDNWCYLNTLENIERNNCTEIEVLEGTASLLGDKKYDRIIANINRNILLEDMGTYASCLKSNGALYLSGFYTEDIPVINEQCEKHSLIFNHQLERENWVALKFLKQ